MHFFQTSVSELCHAVCSFFQSEKTEGDPLAMPMYAMATIPLIKKLKDKVNDINQVWYADDASEGGKIKRLREWWDQLNAIGPKFGYFPNVSKT